MAPWPLNTPEHAVVCREEWEVKRKLLLEKEKELTRQRDAVAKMRRELPWRVIKNYEFEGGTTLRDLFGSSTQLIVYHFRFEEDGCESCSMLADGFDGALPHLKARDTQLVAISNAPQEKLDAYKSKLGWQFPWISSKGTEFGADFGVSFDLSSFEELDQGNNYNFGTQRVTDPEAPGLSVFVKGAECIYHAYSTYARGLDVLMATYNFLDMTPKGRDESHFEYPRAWVQRRTEYSEYVKDNWWSVFFPYADSL